ncbi:MAG: carboxypeptidase-like regulatory domain-containing protein [Acidobacteriia bacterium]|nr:carboxypeptidase-like regulatory domain-containing protein [Terriglobia bacterium]
MVSSFKLKHAGIATIIFGLAIVAGLGIALSFTATPALAQAATGTLEGTVTDQQGAVIAGAEIKMVEPTTNSTRTATSNDVGRFTIVNIPPGTYDVTVTKTGFTAAKYSAQKIDVGGQLTLNVSLTIGATTTTVEVQATAGAELQTLNATVGTTITNESLNLLPNLGRDASALSVLQVGVSLSGNVAGAATDQNSFQLDGVNNSDDMAGTNSTYVAANGYSGSGSTGGTPSGVIPTPIESIEEFKVGTTGQTADFNAAGGSQVQMVTKRGTNAFHGALYEYYFANNVGAANTWSNNHAGCSTATGVCKGVPLPSTHRNRYGLAVGGPLTPKVLGGKTYFFVNYEAMRYPNGASFERGVPTALMRQGILQLTNTQGQLTSYNLNPTTVNGIAPAQCVINGASGSCDPRGIGLNPTISKIWNTLPLPNDPAFTAGNTTTGYVDGTNAQGYLSNVALPQSSNFVVGRIDHDFGDKWRFMASYRYYTFTPLVTAQVDITNGNDKALAPRPVKPSFWTAGLTTTITTNITNDFRFGFLRNYWQWFTAGGPVQLPGLGAAVEIGGESNAGSLIPINVDSQDVRQRFWDGHDLNLTDSVSHLHGNHLIQYGGSYLRNYDYHARNDNGVGIFSDPVYQVGGTNLNTAAYVLPTGAATSNQSAYPIMFNEITGLVNQTQVMYTRSGQNLTLNPGFGTSGYDQSILPTYELYATDTWHLRPTLTLTYGMAWGVAMPPYELNGKQVEMINTANNQLIDINSYLHARQAAALQGQVYEPQIAFANIRNVPGQNLKYPFDPYWGGFAPRVSLAWSPNASGGVMGKIFGQNKTVIRGGYSRIQGRLNGVNMLLVPLLGPGLLQAVSCQIPTITGQCGVGTPATGFRIGVDGNSAPLPGQGALANQVSQTLPQPFIPGYTQNGSLNAAAADGSGLDPKIRPNHSDEVNISIQRSINNRMMFEVGYIGRKISNEFQEINIDAVPYMTTLGGQSYAQAFATVYQQLCGGLVTTCTANPGAVQSQPFFEKAMGGASSPYCAGSASCTAAVVKNEQANFQNGKGFNVWSDLSSKNGWTLGRSLYIQPGAGQQFSGGYDFINSLGHGNYNAAYFSFTAKDWHGLTARSNLTYGRALGTGSVVQASSTITVPDPFNFDTFGTYGVQPFDVKLTYSLLMMYQEPFFKSQKGVVGHILGGWTLAPLFTARSGLPLRVTDLASSGGAFGATYSGQTANYENAVLAAPFTGGNSANYNTVGSAGIATTGGKFPTGVNMFANPVAIYNEFRTPVLGVDGNSGGTGPIRGFPFWNVDATLSKDFRATEKIGATLMIQFVNLLNHFTPADPPTSLASPATFGVVSSQYTQPNGVQARWMEFGLRLRF